MFVNFHKLPVSESTTIRKELEDYHPDMTLKKEVILLTKSDVYAPSLLTEKVNAIKSKIKEWKGKDVLVVSVYDIDSLKNLSDFLTKEFAETNKKELEEISHDEQADQIGDFDTNESQKSPKKIKKIERKPRVVKSKKEPKAKGAKVAKSRTYKK